MGSSATTFEGLKIVKQTKTKQKHDRGWERLNNNQEEKWEEGKAK